LTLLEPVWEALESSPPLRIAAILVATVAASIVLELLFGRVVRALTSRTRTDLDDTVMESLRPAVRWTVIVAGLSACLPLLELDEGPRGILHSVAKTLLVVLWSSTAIRVLSTVIRRLGATERIRGLEPRTVPLFDTIQKVGITAAAIYLILVTWSIDVTGWVASAGIAGIALGFAAKDTLANLFAGIFILADSPYKVGDMVVFETGERGRVTDVGLRSTRILTRDDVEIIVPNSVIGNGRVTNESGGPQPRRRVDVRVGVSYASDVDRVREILMSVAGGLEHACDEPAPRVRFREMSDSALTFSLLFWVEMPEQRGAAIDEANTAIFKRFAAEGVEIPFPQRVVHHVGAPPRDDPAPSRGA